MKTDELDQLIKWCEIAPRERKVIEPLGHDVVERLRTPANLSVREFCDAFARRVAHQYSSAELSFDTGDAAMNALYDYVRQHFDVTLPSYAEDVYLAFDEGEYKHAEDGDEVDPREKYTRPRIGSLVIRDQVLG